MPHPLVTRLRFARSEFLRCLEGVSPEEARHRFEPMNCISWIVGHLAWQEHLFWVLWAQGKDLAPDLRELVGRGRPASTPPLAEMWAAWHTITHAANPYLDTLTSERLQTYFAWEGRTISESVGTLLLRNTYHYWFHTGQAYAIRQLLGHIDLPEFVREDMSAVAYWPERWE